MRSTQSVAVQAGHLNDDQFADFAMGAESTAAVTDHLMQCEACREELAVFGVSVESFNRVTMVWSESRPAASLRAASAEGASWRRILAGRLWAPSGWALAVVMLVVFGVSVTVRHEQGVRQAKLAANIAVVAPVQQDSDAQIAQDNKFLVAVDVAIRSDERSPIEEYALQRLANAHGGQRGRFKD